MPEDQEPSFPTQYWMEALIVLPTGERTTFTATYTTGEKLPDGGTVVGFHDEFFYEKAEEVANEMGGEVEDVDFGMWEESVSLPNTLDMF